MYSLGPVGFFKNAPSPQPVVKPGSKQQAEKLRFKYQIQAPDVHSRGKTIHFSIPKNEIGESWTLKDLEDYLLKNSHLLVGPSALGAFEYSDDSVACLHLSELLESERELGMSDDLAKELEWIFVNESPKAGFGILKLNPVWQAGEYQLLFSVRNPALLPGRLRIQSDGALDDHMPLTEVLDWCKRSVECQPTLIGMAKKFLNGTRRAYQSNVEESKEVTGCAARWSITNTSTGALALKFEATGTGLYMYTGKVKSSHQKFFQNAFTKTYPQLNQLGTKGIICRTNFDRNEGSVFQVVVSDAIEIEKIVRAVTSRDVIRFIQVALQAQNFDHNNQPTNILGRCPQEILLLIVQVLNKSGWRTAAQCWDAQAQSRSRYKPQASAVKAPVKKSISSEVPKGGPIGPPSSEISHKSDELVIRQMNSESQPNGEVSWVVNEHQENASDNQYRPAMIDYTSLDDFFLQSAIGQFDRNSLPRPGEFWG